MRPCILLLVVAFTATTATVCKAEFLESFTTNPEIDHPYYSKVTPFLWVQNGAILAGGRGPADPANPNIANCMQLSSEGWVVETNLMNWLAGGNSTQTMPHARLSFYLEAGTQCCCSKLVGMLKLLYSNDSMVWQAAWSRTLAQMIAEPGWQPVQVTLPNETLSAPIAFKWVLTVSPKECESKFWISLDDITFPTIPPSADTRNLGKASPAPLPSPAVCSALTVFCHKDEEVPARVGGTIAGGTSGRKLRHMSVDTFAG